MTPTEELKKKALALLEHAIRLDAELWVLRTVMAGFQHSYHCEEEIRAALDTVGNAPGVIERSRQKYAQLAAEFELLAADQQGRVQ